MNLIKYVHDILGIDLNDKYNQGRIISLVKKFESHIIVNALEIAIENCEAKRLDTQAKFWNYTYGICSNSLNLEDTTSSDNIFRKGFKNVK